MARPSKITLELRKQIIDLGVFKRDSKIYTNFEDFSYKNNTFLPQYYFSLECSLRNEKDNTAEGYYKNSMVNRTKSFIDNPAKAFREDNFTNETVYDIKAKIVYGMIFKKDDDVDEILGNHWFYKPLKQYEKINNFSTKIAEYYLFLSVSSYYNHFYKNFKDKRYDNNPYFIHNEIDKDLTAKILRETLSKERYEYFIKFYMRDIRIDILLEKGFIIDDPLTSEEKENILKEISKYDYRIDKTIIGRTPMFTSMNNIIEDKKNKNVHVELDLTKSKEELFEYVSKLKDDFDEDSLKFPNIYEILGEKQEVLSCDLGNCDIYKDTRSLKPISGRLADVLFIYDCKKINEIFGADVLDNSFIEDEINRYWIEIKNISTDKFSSISDYYKIAKEYIDNQKYKDYLTGVKT